MVNKLTRMKPASWLTLLALLLATAMQTAFALDSAEQDLLSPDQAFRFSAKVADTGTLRVSWDIADGYYLYRDRIRFSTDTPGIELHEAELPAGEIKDDEFFGRLAIYRHQAVVTIPYSRAGDAPAKLKLSAVSQGCADIGVCFPPHTQVAELALPAAAPAGAADASKPLESLSDRLGLGAAGDEQFLDADEAFQVNVTSEGPDRLLIRWDIAEGYYLYRDKLKVQLAGGNDVVLGSPSVPAGETKHDEFFGDVQIFHHEAEMRVPLTRGSPKTTEISVQVAYQGCAEAGICYPPIKKTLSLSLPAVAAGQGDAAGAVTAAGQPGTGPASTGITSRQDDIARILREGSAGWIALSFFGAGILLAFTACMYPMIPILSSIIVGQGAGITTARAFGLSLIYVEAMALTYAVIGVISAQVGAGVQAFFQNPWILTLFALIFVTLALSMFGFFNLQLPASWQARLSHASHRQKGGTLIGVAVMGALSALIVGPCAGPVLIGALLYSSQTGDYLTGALAMFALGNGMGAPLLVICTSGGKLLPKAGAWMNTVKAVFGVVLLGVAVLMLERILPGPVTMVLWALLLIIPAVYMGALERVPGDASGWHRLWKGLGIAMLVYGVILMVGAATGARDPFNPLRNLSPSTAVESPAGAKHASPQLPFQRIKSIEDFDAALKESTRQGKPAMLDFYADWCTYCVKMEDYTFSDARVRQALSDVTLLQADVTANDSTDLALLNHFKLFAPPAILFFAADGSERTDYRLIGYLNADEFLAHVKGALGK